MKKRAAILVTGLLLSILFVLFSGCEVSVGDEPAVEEKTGSVTGSKLAPPDYSIAGKVSPEPLKVKLTTKDGAKIYYLKVDGHEELEPAADKWLLYNHTDIDVGVVMPKETQREQLFTIWSYSEKDGKTSDPIRQFYKITGTIHVVIEIRPDPDLPGKSRAVIISYPPEAIKKFTLDGKSRPTREKGDFFTSKPDELDRAILITEVVAIKAFAYLDGWLDSDVVSKDTVLSIEKVGFNPVETNRIYDYGIPLEAFSTLTTADIFYKEYTYNNSPAADAIPEERSAAEAVVPAANRTVHGAAFKNILSPMKVAVRGFSKDAKLTPSRCYVLDFKVRLPQAKIIEVGATVKPGDHGGKIVDGTSLTVRLELDPESVGMPPSTDIGLISGHNFYYAIVATDVVPETGTTLFEKYDDGTRIILNSTQKLVVFSSKAADGQKTHDGTTGVNGWVDSAFQEQKYYFELVKPTINLDKSEYNSLPEKLIIGDIGSADKVYFTINSQSDAVVTDPDAYIYKYEGGKRLAKKIGDPDSAFKEIILNDDISKYFNADSNGKLLLKIQSVKEILNGDDITSPLFTKEFIFKLKNPTGFKPEPAYAGDFWLKDSFNLSITAANGDIMFKELKFDSSDLLDKGVLMKNTEILYGKYGDSDFARGGALVDKTMYFAFQVTKENWASSEELVKRYIFRPSKAAIIGKNNPEGTGVDGSTAKPYKDPTTLTLGCATTVDSIYYTLEDTSAITSGYPTIADKGNLSYAFKPLNTLSGPGQSFEKLTLDYSGTVSYFSFKEGWQPSEIVRESFSFQVKTPQFSILKDGVESLVNSAEIDIKPGEKVKIDLDYPQELKKKFTLIYNITYTEGGNVSETIRHSLLGGPLEVTINSPQTVKVTAIREISDGKGGWIELSSPSAEAALQCNILIDKVKVTEKESNTFDDKKIVKALPEKSVVNEFDDFLGEMVDIDVIKYLYVLKDKPAPRELTVLMKSDSTDSVVVKYTNSASESPAKVEKYFNNSAKPINVIEAGTTFTAWMEEDGNSAIRSSKVRTIFDFKVAAPQYSDPDTGVIDLDSGIDAPDAKRLTGDTIELICPTLDTKVSYTLTYIDESGTPQEVKGTVVKDLDDKYFIPALPQISPLNITMHGERTDMVGGREYKWVNSDEVTTVFYRELPLPTLDKRITINELGEEVETLDDIDVEKLLLSSSIPGVDIHYSMDNEATYNFQPVEPAPANSLTLTVPFESPVKVNYQAKKSGWINSRKLWTDQANTLTLKRRLKVTKFAPAEMNGNDSFTSISIESNAPQTLIKYEVDDPSVGPLPVVHEYKENEPFSVTTSQSVKIISFTKDGWISPESYPAAIEVKKCKTPLITLNLDSTNPENDKLSFSDTDIGAVISYNISAVDASGGVKNIEQTVTYDGTPITMPFLMSDYESKINIYASATKAGFLKSDTAKVENYKRELSKPKLLQTAFNNTTRSITLRFQNQPEGGKIYWRKDAPPVEGGAGILYTPDSGININSACTIYAIAVKDNWKTAVMTAVRVTKCAVPTFKRESGSGTVLDIGGNRNILIDTSTTTDGISIVYQKINARGSWPVAWSPYHGKVAIDQDSLIKAKVVVSASSQFYLPSEVSAVKHYNVRLAIPSNIEIGRNADEQIDKVRFTHIDTGLALSYNISGRTGTVASNVWVSLPASFYNVTSRLNISVVAEKSGFSNSPAKTATYTQRLARPSNIEIGRNADDQIVKVRFPHTDTGLTFSYNISGRTGTVASNVWVALPASFYNITSPLTVSVVAVKSGFSKSFAKTATYTQRLAKPSNIEVDRNADGQIYRVRFPHADTGLTFSYNISGRTGTVASNGWVSLPASFYNITSPLNISVFAVKSGFDDSLAKTETYKQRVAKPVVSFSPGSSSSNKKLTISCATPNVDIYYTTNGSTPKTSSIPYRAGELVSSGVQIKAIAVRRGWDNSVISN